MVATWVTQSSRIGRAKAPWVKDATGRGSGADQDPEVEVPVLVQMRDLEGWPLAGAHAEAHRDGLHLCGRMKWSPRGLSSSSRNTGLGVQ